MATTFDTEPEAGLGRARYARVRWCSLLRDEEQTDRQRPISSSATRTVRRSPTSISRTRRAGATCAAILDMSILYRAATLKSSSRAVGYCYILLRRGGVVRS
jgi:hypothetical protein